MKNIINYVEDNLDTFEKRPFNDVDSLVLSDMSYLSFKTLIKNGKKMSIQQLLRAEYFNDIFYRQQLGVDNKRLFYACAASPRFRDIQIAFVEEKFDKESEMQFYALTYIINDDLAYIAYRGTDGTMVGWKEDFNMAFTYPVPAQLLAKDYIDRVGYEFPSTFYVGGHSKGGNLAVYASAFADEDVKERIGKVFSHDGPGFRPEFMNSEEYLSIIDRISKTVPQSSIIGMVLEHQENYRIIKSSASGLYQHNPFTWEIEDTDFIYNENLTMAANTTNDTVSTWLNSLDDEKRALFVDTLFDIIDKAGITSMSQIQSNWRKFFMLIMKNIKILADEPKSAIKNMMKSFSKIALSNFWNRNENYITENEIIINEKAKKREPRILRRRYLSKTKENEKNYLEK